MSGFTRDYRKGIALAFSGAMVLTFDVPLIRLAETSAFQYMTARGIALFCILYLYWRFFSQHKRGQPRPWHDPDFIIIGTLHGINNIFFSLAVFLTSTANLVFILAFNPMIAAALGWWLLGEKPRPITWAAMLVTFIGVMIIVGEGLEGGTWYGDASALICALMLALTIVLTRRSRKDMSLAPGFGGLVVFVFALPMTIYHFEMPGTMGWLLLNVLFLVPFASFTLALAPSFIPAPQVAMFFLLETVLAPVWVWLIFGDTLSTQTAIGGSIVLTALIVHSVWQLRRDDSTS